MAADGFGVLRACFKSLGSCSTLQGWTEKYTRVIYQIQNGSFLSPLSRLQSQGDGAEKSISAKY